MPSSLRVTEYAVAADATPLQGLAIAVIADLQAGAPFIDERKLDDVVARTNAARPDLILLAGDYSGGMAAGILAARLSRLEARMGVFAVLGEADAAEDDAPDIGAALEQAGIFVLRNFHIVLDTPRGPLMLAGIGEGNGRALQNIPAGGTVLCLTHAPPPVAALPRPCALTVAGHSHDGQFALPFFGADAIRRDGGRTLFVSPGIGTIGLPARLGAVPEISLLRIQ